MLGVSRGPSPKEAVQRAVVAVKCARLLLLLLLLPVLLPE